MDSWSVYVADRCDSLRDGGFTNFFVSMLVYTPLPFTPNSHNDLGDANYSLYLV